MTLRGVIRVLVIAAIAIPLAVIVALNFLDFTRFRPQIEVRLSDAIGRKVELGGEINLRVDYRPTLRLSDVTIANAPWGRADALASLGSVFLELELLPLLQGDIVIEDVRLADVVINLQESQEHGDNWDIDVDVGNDQNASDQQSGGSGPKVALRVLTIETLNLHHTDQFGATDFQLSNARFTIGADNERIDGRLVGEIEGFPFDMTLGLASLSKLVEGKGQSEATLGGVFGGVQFDGEGSVAIADGKFTYKVETDATALEFARLAPDLKPIFPNARPFQASGTVEGGIDGLKATGLEVTLADQKASVVLDLRYPREDRHYKGTLRSDHLVLIDLLPPSEADGDEEEHDKDPPTAAKIGTMDFKEQLEALTGLGLPVRAIDGEFTVVDLESKLAIHALEIANPDWARGDALLKLDEFTLDFNYVDLVQDQLTFDQAELFSTKVALETGDNGESNWQYLSLPQELEGGSDSGGPLWLKRLKITDFELSYADATSRYHGGIDAASLRMEQQDAALSGFLQGKIVDFGYETDLSIAGFSGVLDDPSSTSLAVDGIFGGLKANLSTALNDGKMSSQGSIEAQAPGALAPMFRKVLPAVRPLKVAFSMDANDETIELSPFTLTLGQSDISGQGSVDLSSATPNIVAKLTSDKLRGEDLGLLGSEAQGDGGDDEASDIDLDVLKEFDADIGLTSNEMTIDRFTVNEVNTQLTLSDGHLSINPFGLKIGKGTIDASLDVKPNDDTWDIGQDIDIRNVPIDLVFAGTSVPDYIEATFYFESDLKASGATLDDLLKTANGTVRLYVHDGEVQAQLLDLLVGGLREVLGSLVSADRNGWSKLNCAVLEGPITDGVLEPRILYVDTAASSIAGKGKIDFAKDSVDLVLTPRSSGATLNISVPVRVHGSLDNPNVTPRPDLGTALKGLTVAASAFLFPPAAIAAFVDFGVGDRCLKAASQDQPGSENTGSNPSPSAQ